MKIKTLYVSEPDGQSFESEEDCRQHEADLKLANEIYNDDAIPGGLIDLDEAIIALLIPVFRWHFNKKTK